MSRKPKKGYFVRGHFVAEGSELDEELRRERDGEGPSKTALKAQSAELQALGEQILTLRAGLLEPLGLPTRLIDALQELARIKDFEGRRRQSQFVGKLMRLLGEDDIAAIRSALDEQHRGSAADTLLLHTLDEICAEYDRQLDGRQLDGELMPWPSLKPPRRNSGRRAGRC